MNNEQILQEKIDRILAEPTSDQNSARSMFFNYDDENKTWCFSGETISGLLWETEDMEANDKNDAILQAIVYLDTLDSYEEEDYD